MSLSPQDRDRISLCMIVRDEEQDLPRCLLSAQGWAGEIVVVDTGSRDNTVPVARSLGARVVPFAWCDDFSAARNVSLEAATRPWALVLDADDELVVSGPDEIARAVRQDTVAGFELVYRNILDGGLTSRCGVFRLFRRDLPRMRYRGQVHEQIAAVGDQEVATGRIHHAHINHYGYQSGRMEQKDKRGRNMRLCQALVETRPDEPFSWFCLAMQQSLDDPPGAVRSYRRVLELVAAGGGAHRGQPYVAQTYVGLVKLLQFLGEDAAAERCLADGLRWFPESAELLFLRAEQLLARGDDAGAARDLEVCVAPQRGEMLFVTCDAITSYEGRTLLGAAYLRLGRFPEAEAQLRQAAAQAVPDFAKAHRLLGTMLLCLRSYEEAIPYLREALARDPEGSSSLRVSLAEALLHAGQRDEALQALAPIADEDPARALIARIRAPG